MSRLVLSVFVLAVLIGCAGCNTMQRAFNGATSNHYYEKDGYRVDGPYAFFKHTETPNENVMTLGFSYGQKIYTDQESDGKVDEIQFEGQRYHRDDPGAEQMFAQADEEWAYCFRKMHLDEVDAKWRGMSLSERAQVSGYSEYKH